MSNEICGTCKQCHKNIRGNKTGFCVSPENNSTYLVSFDHPACKNWEPKQEEKNG